MKYKWNPKSLVASLESQCGDEEVGVCVKAGGRKVRYDVVMVRGLGRSYACVFDVCNPLSPP